MDKLKKCPFCGGTPMLLPQIMWSDMTKRFFVSCLGCGVETKRTYRTQGEAIEVWNRIHSILRQ